MDDLLMLGGLGVHDVERQRRVGLVDVLRHLLLGERFAQVEGKAEFVGSDLNQIARFQLALTDHRARR